MTHKQTTVLTLLIALFLVGVICGASIAAKNTCQKSPTVVYVTLEEVLKN